MELLLQLLASGAVTGCIYALIAIGFVVVYKATGVINFATGELMMLGSFFAWTAMTAAQAPFAAALLVALGLVIAAGAWMWLRLKAAELRANSERLHRFADISAVEGFLDELIHKFLFD